MEGIYIVKNGDYVTGVRQEQSFLGLLASYEGMDIMQLEIYADKPMWIDPGSSSELMEYFYILDGSVSIIDESGEEKLLEKGDCFYVANIKKSIPAKSANGVKMLYISTKPVFNYLYSYTGDLNELRRRCEEKDQYTKNHSNRVMEYSVKICENLGLSKEITNTLVISSLFHDIGKCMIPDEILKKPTSLNREELRYIMKHPIFSRSFVEGKFGKQVAEIVEQHHERPDGSGYPYGLSGKEILPEARIIAVADSYDAMTTDRAYKKAVTPREALNELRLGEGSRYDRDAVKALAKYLKDINRV
ncbi:MAG: HD domain-containing protein [Clostridia bacterium]|nr:HD domain-containing protein [Clostridia bacterium]